MSQQLTSTAVNLARFQFGLKTNSKLYIAPQLMLRPRTMTVASRRCARRQEDTDCDTRQDFGVSDKNTESTIRTVPRSFGGGGDVECKPSFKQIDLFSWRRMKRRSFLPALSDPHLYKRTVYRTGVFTYLRLAVSTAEVYTNKIS